MRQFNILISGAGIAGSALAYWLDKFGAKVTVIEKTSHIRKGGYRIDLRGKAVEVVERMGIIDKIRSSATAMQGSSFINGDGKRFASLNDPNIFGMRELGDIEIMRGNLVELLYQHNEDRISYIFNRLLA